MPRFFVEPKSIKESKVNIRGAEARHISAVLRLERGDMISVFDGTGREYAMLIEKSSSSRVEGRVIQEKVVETESIVEVTLFQALPKSSKMDFIVEKCTELGVTKIVPVITSRTIPQIENKIENRKTRWERIARESSKQCGRLKVTEIGDLMNFNDAFEVEMDLRIIPWEDERKTIKEALQSCKVQIYPCRIGIFIGPEGGFTRDEIGYARHRGAIPVSLGPRVLRTETAGMVTLTIVMHEFEPSTKRMEDGSDN